MKLIPLPVSILALFAFAGCGGTGATVTTSGRPMANRIGDLEGLPNFARVDDRVYRGGQPTAEGYRKLKELGVKTVINFRSHHSYRKEIEAAGLRCVEIPLQADLIGSEPPSENQLKDFFDTVLDPAQGPVFIHCMKGQDRTGTLCAVYRMEALGWTRDEAIEEMQAFGFNDYYSDLMKYVRTYAPRGYAPVNAKK